MVVAAGGAKQASHAADMFKDYSFGSRAPNVQADQAPTEDSQLLSTPRLNEQVVRAAGLLQPGMVEPKPELAHSQVAVPQRCWWPQSGRGFEVCRKGTRRPTQK